MFVFRRHLIKRGSYKQVKEMYQVRIDDGYLPTQSTMDELIRDKQLIGSLQANFEIEVDAEVAEATTREESMDSYYNDMKKGAPVQCIGRRTRKKHRCAICMRKKKTKIKLRCGHIFHRKCVDTWASWRPVCPTCKDALDLKPQSPKPVLPPPPPPNTPILAPDTEGSSASAPSI
jgi:hypothetical protein